MQAKMLIENLEKLVITSKSGDSPGVQLVICGSLNAEPNSAVYDLFSKGRLPKDHPQVKVRCVSFDTIQSVTLFSSR